MTEERYKKIKQAFITSTGDTSVDGKYDKKLGTSASRETLISALFPLWKNDYVHNGHHFQ